MNEWYEYVSMMGLSARKVRYYYCRSTSEGTKKVRVGLTLGTLSRPHPALKLVVRFRGSRFLVKVTSKVKKSTENHGTRLLILDLFIIEPKLLLLFYFTISSISIQFNITSASVHLPHSLF